MLFVTASGFSVYVGRNVFICGLDIGGSAARQLVIDKEIDRAIVASALKYDPCPGIDRRRTGRDDLADIVMLQFPFSCRTCRCVHHAFEVDVWTEVFEDDQ